MIGTATRRSTGKTGVSSGRTQIILAHRQDNVKPFARI
jgi:hypothetical protein